MAQPKYKPFHPVGLAGTTGGVLLVNETVILKDTAGNEVDRRVYAGGYNSLYVNKRLLDLFRNNGLWYTGKPWVQPVEFQVTNRTEFFVEGEIKYQGTTRPLSWEAHRHYSSPPVWSIEADLPPDHQLAGDIGLQISLGQAIYEKIETGEEQWGTTVTNLFDDFPVKLPFRVNWLADCPTDYLEEVYGWLWKK